MPYTKNPTWVDWPSLSTQITAATLNNLDNGVYNATLTADSAVQPIPDGVYPPACRHSSGKMQLLTPTGSSTGPAGYSYEITFVPFRVDSSRTVAGLAVTTHVVTAAGREDDRTMHFLVVDL